jgi:hypothetical protein
MSKEQSGTRPSRVESSIDVPDASHSYASNATFGNLAKDVAENGSRRNMPKEKSGACTGRSRLMIFLVVFLSIYSLLVENKVLGSVKTSLEFGREEAVATGDTTDASPTVAPYAYPTNSSTSSKVGMSVPDQAETETEIATSRVEQERQDVSAEEDAEQKNQKKEASAEEDAERNNQKEKENKQKKRNKRYRSMEEQNARSTRFPSVETRVKFSMSNWYVPPCADSDGAFVLYQPLSTSKQRSYVLREISVGKQTNSSQSGNTTAAALIQVDPGMQAENIFSLDRESVPETSVKEYRRFLLEYAKDPFKTMLPLFGSLNGAPLLTQWGDRAWSRSLRFGQPGAPPINNTAVPIIKKFRAVVSRDELDRVTSADCYGTNRPQSGMTGFAAIVWKLNSNRHFGPLKYVEQNDIPWKKKRNQAVSRGGANSYSDAVFSAKTQRAKCLAIDRCRIVLLSGNSTLLDIRLTKINKERTNGLQSTVDGVQLVGKEFSMRKLLKYKAIIMVQGNDVASGLKWALMSNSVLIIPPPTLTTWAMEEFLEPWVHYIPLDPSLSDAEEKMQWVLDHDKEAQQIAHRGGLWMKDMVYHPDAAKDDQAVYKEILRRYQSHFRASDKLI